MLNEITFSELTRKERIDLAQLETVIQGGLKGFRAVGEALEQIHSQRLYRQTHSTFEAYCQERWKFTERRARQFMRAREVGTNVPEIQNEAQARALAGRSPEMQREVFAEASADGKIPTAASLSALLAEIDQAEIPADPVSERPRAPVPSAAELDEQVGRYARMVATQYVKLDMRATGLTRAQLDWLAANPFTATGAKKRAS